jgi:hypothetical protein
MQPTIGTNTLHDILLSLSAAPERSTTTTAAKTTTAATAVPANDPKKQRLAELLLAATSGSSCIRSPHSHYTVVGRPSKRIRRRQGEAQGATATATAPPLTPPQQHHHHHHHHHHRLKSLSLSSIPNQTQEIIELSRLSDKIRALRQLYLYGLQKVSLLQDLRDAPDAILPGSQHVVEEEC